MPNDPSRLLTLGQAAERMGVHPTTLRRWADRGEIPVIRTPGGHRRFAPSELDALAHPPATPPATGVEFAWAGKAMTRVRQQLARPESARWLTGYSDAERTEYRELGRRLMGVAMHFIAGGTDDDRLLGEAATIGRAQAQLALRHDLTLTQTLGAALSFRDTLLEVSVQLPEHARSSPDASARIVRRINTLLNVVQLAISETYERTYAVEAG